MSKSPVNGRQVALITGASSGIGEALAFEYARRGFDVIALARREDRLTDLQREIESVGVDISALQCDVTRDGELQNAVEAGLERFGRIDHVHANAGFGVAGWFHKLGIDDYRRQFETNVFGVLRTASATRNALIESRGCLALMGSVNSYVALPGTSPYSMSKHCVAALAGSLRHEFGVHGVSVSLVAPGFVASEIRKVDNRGRLSETARDPMPSWLVMGTEVAAQKIVRGVIRRRRVVIITLHGKFAVMLQRHAPGLLSFLVRKFGISGRREPASRV